MAAIISGGRSLPSQNFRNSANFRQIKPEKFEARISKSETRTEIPMTNAENGTPFLELPRFDPSKIVSDFALRNSNFRFPPYFSTA
jgi:hypothetical protein